MQKLCITIESASNVPLEPDELKELGSRIKEQFLEHNFDECSVIIEDVTDAAGDIFSC